MAEACKKVDISLEMLERSNPMMPATQSRVLMKGTMEKKGTGYLITYMEDITDDHSSMTEVRMHVNDNRVMILRSGEYSSTFVFEDRLHYDTMYRTPFGDFPLSIHTTVLVNELTDEMGAIHVEYQVFMDGNPSFRIMNLMYQVEENGEYDPSERDEG